MAAALRFRASEARLQEMRRGGAIGVTHAG